MALFGSGADIVMYKMKSHKKREMYLSTAVRSQVCQEYVPLVAMSGLSAR